MKNITDMKTLREAILKESLIEPLNEALFNSKNLENDKISNKYGISEKDMTDELEGFPVGIVVRMIEEQEKQRNKPNVKVFQERKGADRFDGGFDWNKTETGFKFWDEVIMGEKFKLFFEEYLEYEKYN